MDKRMCEALGGELQCENEATHEATDFGRAYCCEHFNHDWPDQRLLPGRECEMERVEVPSNWTPAVRFVWRRKEVASG